MHDCSPPMIFVENDPGIPVGRIGDPFAGLDAATVRELREAVDGTTEGHDNVLAVPHTHQATNYSCGAAALVSCLHYWCVYEGKERSLYDALETDPQEGTSLQKLAEIGQLFGLRAEVRHGLSVDDLRSALSRNVTAILLLQSNAGDPENPCAAGHYVVVLGIDAEHIYVMDPASSNKLPSYMPLAQLEQRWYGCDGPGQTIQRGAVCLRGRVMPEPTHEALTQAVLIEAKAIGTAQMYGQVSMRDLVLRHQGAFASTLRSRIRQASTNAVRDLRPVVEDAERGVLAILLEWFAGHLSYREAQMQTAKEWRRAYERVREIGRRASGIDRHANVNPSVVHEEEKWFRSAVREELTYWNTFMHEINEDQVSEERLLERLAAYLKALRFMYEGARVLGLPDNVLLYWLGPRDERLCAGCEYVLERSPFTKNTIPAVPRDGSTPCLTNCRHKIVVRVVENRADVQQRERVLEARGTMVRALRAIKHEEHGGRHHYVRRIASRAHPHAKNPFHNAPPLPPRTSPFQL